MSESNRTLILSQDYELFFQDSGSIERCLFDPCDALTAFADANGLKFTFFVDAGMLLAMERFSNKVSSIGKDLSRIKRHLGQIAADGHELALHIHPHWEDTLFVDGEWRFENTRYQLSDFDQEDIQRIVRSYAECIGEISGSAPTSYRAGGFCLEPFAPVGLALDQIGIHIDSSVVPGACLNDQNKGFDFSDAPDEAYWKFEQCPTSPETNGRFIEVAVTPLKLPPMFYWHRLIDRLSSKRPKKHFGDGLSKSIGRSEIFRRLAARSRVSELSMDDAKAEHLLEPELLGSDRVVWHVMGHPKLASRKAIGIVEQFIEEMKISSFETVTSFATTTSASNPSG